MIVLAALQTSAWACVALIIGLPLALLSAWALRSDRDTSHALAAVRFLSFVPLAALALSFAGTHGWLGWWALGAYAPLTLALRDVLRGLDPREPQGALALGLSQQHVLRVITLPLLSRPIAVALLRVLARLVGEAGLFIVITGAPVLGATAWTAPSAALALGVAALAFAALAQRVGARR